MENITLNFLISVLFKLPSLSWPVLKFFCYSCVSYESSKTKNKNHALDQYTYASKSHKGDAVS